VQATKSRPRFEVTTDAISIGHADAALLAELAERLELSRALGWRTLCHGIAHPPLWLARGRRGSRMVQDER
jgi:hypothetical protein